MGISFTPSQRVSPNCQTSFLLLRHTRFRAVIYRCNNHQAFFFTGNDTVMTSNPSAKKEKEENLLNYYFTG